MLASFRLSYPSPPPPAHATARKYARTHTRITCLHARKHAHKVLPRTATPQVTELSARITFNQAQMFVVNPTKEPKHQWMSFEDFLDGFARLACTVARDDDERPMVLRVTEMYVAFFQRVLER